MDLTILEALEITATEVKAYVDEKQFASSEEIKDIQSEIKSKHYTKDEIDVKVDVINRTISVESTSAKTYADLKDTLTIETSKSYTDGEIAKKSQVQIIKENNPEILQTLKIHKLTQEEYDQALKNGTLDENALYLTPNEAADLSGYATIEALERKANLSDLELLQNMIPQIQIVTWEAHD